MTNQQGGRYDPEKELGALVRESERLQRHSAELQAEKDALRARMAQLYIDVAPLNRRRGERRRPRARDK
ncbi:MAG: hypothetical protein ACREMZ_13530 [Gemmatimonadales bacterium]